MKDLMNEQTERTPSVRYSQTPLVSVSFRFVLLRNFLAKRIADDRTNEGRKTKCTASVHLSQTPVVFVLFRYETKRSETKRMNERTKDEKTKCTASVHFSQTPLVFTNFHELLGGDSAAPRIVLG